jgi:thiamine biosynthesis lipoprotein
MDLMMPSTKLETKPELSWQFQALGTSWEIISNLSLDARTRTAVENEIDTFDRVYSRFRSDSLVQIVSQKIGDYTFPENAKTIFGLYDELYALTNGSVTPLVGDTLASAGYDSEYSLRPQKTIKPVAEYPKVIQRKRSQLSLESPTLIDIGAIGKGYMIDSIVEVLKEAGHTDFIVDGSGDMRAVGARREVIGLENPFNLDEVIGTVTLEGRALCASAVNRRSWGEWHHVIDPHTSQPTKDIVATWVIADSAMVADGLATALFFSSPQTLASKYTYEYIRVHDNGSIEYSDYFSQGVFE